MSSEPSFGDWANHALAHASVLGRQGRASAAASEAKAAEYVRQQLAGLGVNEVRTQPFRGLRSIWLFLSLAFGTALIGHTAYWLLGRPLGVWAALAVSTLAFGFAAFLLWRKFTFRDYPLRQSLPHGPSQNIIAQIPASQETRSKVVFHAHLDSHRAVVWFANDGLLTLYELLAPVAFLGVVLSPLFYVLAALGLAEFSWLNLAFALVHFLVWFTGVTADLGPYSPGANDNAASAGELLALAERLQQQPLTDTEVWLVFTGCEETGCDGMMAFLDEYAPALKDALFVNLELVGIGERVVYARSEGLVRKRTISPATEKFVQFAGQEVGLQPAPRLGAGAFSETGVVLERGLDGVCFLTLRQNSPRLPEWHRLTDTPARLQPKALERVHRLVWAVLQEFDR